MTINSFTRTEFRERLAGFSDPYYKYHGQFVRRAESRRSTQPATTGGWLHQSRLLNGNHGGLISHRAEELSRRRQTTRKRTMRRGIRYARQDNRLPGTRFTKNSERGNNPEFFAGPDLRVKFSYIPFVKGLRKRYRNSRQHIGGDLGMGQRLCRASVPVLVAWQFSSRLRPETYSSCRFHLSVLRCNAPVRSGDGSFTFKAASSNGRILPSLAVITRTLG